MPMLEGSHPCSSDFLERFRLDARRRYRASLLGPHLQRRRGQSLEFHEFTPYLPGDDARHIDWRASARRGDEEEPLVRRYVAEERLHLVISVDARPTMALPDRPSKLQVAAWLAEAVAWVTLRSEDEVLLHNLFAAVGRAPVKLPRAAGRAHIRRLVHGLVAAPQGTVPQVRVLKPYLPPTTVWLILTDAYFNETAAKAVARAVRDAQDGLRWVILADLDSWPAERSALGTGARRIEGPGLLAPLLRDVYDDGLDQIADRIAAHKQAFLQHAGRTQFDMHWRWPVDPRITPDAFFRAQFDEKKEPVLRRLFMREAL
jgi:uncharacterized protein (DUF58 family)